MITAVSLDSLGESCYGEIALGQYVERSEKEGFDGRPDQVVHLAS